MLSKSELSYDEKLTKLFKELGEYWPSKAVLQSSPSNEKTREQLFMSSDSKNNLCLFLVPDNLISYYREEIYPIVQYYGFVPIKTDEIISKGDNYLAVEQGLINKADVIIIDFSSEYYNERFLSYQIQKDVTLIPIVEEKQEIPLSLSHIKIIRRPKNILLNDENFIEQIELTLSNLSKIFYHNISNEPKRLLDHKEYKMAFISAIILLEVTLRNFFTKLDYDYNIKRASLRQMINIIIKQFEIPIKEQNRINRWNETRNQILHYNEDITSKKAKKYTNEILDFINKLNTNYLNKD